ncbi:MAG TPA: ABC transporter substrate-binding protein, partial [Alcaligenaceae bacterium]|nr:ABC transporter substrate-binding protein [Alcaligenaceae bacterium]
MKIRITPLAAALGLAAGMMATTAAYADTIKFAIAGPFTGALTQYGEMVKQGVDTAVEQFNADGGVLGKKIEVVLMDDACEPKQGPVVANRIVNDEIGYVIGHVCSGATIAATDIYNDEGVVMISASATAPAVTDGKNYETIFRTIGRDDQQGPAAAKMIIEQIKPSKVAVLHDKQSYGQGIASAV